MDVKWILSIKNPWNFPKIEYESSRLLIWFEIIQDKNEIEIIMCFLSAVAAFLLFLEKFQLKNFTIKIEWTLV
jgi:hypothetical protein